MVVARTRGGDGAVGIGGDMQRYWSKETVPDKMIKFQISNAQQGDYNEQY